MRQGITLQHLSKRSLTMSWPKVIRRIEMKTDGFVCTAHRVEPERRRCLVAQAIGHEPVHPGNHLWTLKHIGLAHKYKRESEVYSHALLLNAREAIVLDLTTSWELADQFGVSAKVAELQTPMKLDNG